MHMRLIYTAKCHRFYFLTLCAVYAAPRSVFSLCYSSAPCCWLRRWTSIVIWFLSCAFEITSLVWQQIESQSVNACAVGTPFFIIGILICLGGCCLGFDAPRCNLARQQSLWNMPHMPTGVWCVASQVYFKNCDAATTQSVSSNLWSFRNPLGKRGAICLRKLHSKFDPNDEYLVHMQAQQKDT